MDEWTLSTYSKTYTHEKSNIRLSLRRSAFRDVWIGAETILKKRKVNSWNIVLKAKENYEIVFILPKSNEFNIRIHFFARRINILTEPKRVHCPFKQENKNCLYF